MEKHGKNTKVSLSSKVVLKMSESKTIDKILDVLKKCSPHPITTHYLSLFTGEPQSRLQTYLKFLIDGGLVTREQIPVVTVKGIVFQYGYKVTDKAFDYTVKKKLEKIGEESG